MRRADGGRDDLRSSRDSQSFGRSYGRMSANWYTFNGGTNAITLDNVTINHISNKLGYAIGVFSGTLTITLQGSNNNLAGGKNENNANPHNCWWYGAGIFIAEGGGGNGGNGGAADGHTSSRYGCCGGNGSDAPQIETYGGNVISNAREGKGGYKGPQGYSGCPSGDNNGIRNDCNEKVGGNSGSDGGITSKNIIIRGGSVKFGSTYRSPSIPVAELMMSAI